jgi:hypothetical protein
MGDFYMIMDKNIQTIKEKTSHHMLKKKFGFTLFSLPRHETACPSE